MTGLVLWLAASVTAMSTAPDTPPVRAKTIINGKGADRGDASAPSSLLVITRPQALVLIGAFGIGSAVQVAAVLAKAPAVRRIELDSNGGLLVEAEKIAQLIRDRGLDTVAAGDCLSACTHVLLAGMHRTATRRARIGFHRPFVLADTTQVPDAASPYPVIIARGFYERAHVPAAFIDRVFATPSSTMWYPKRAELLENHILTATAVR